MSKILCIYPDDYSTKFLDRIQNHLKKNFGKDFHCFKIKPNHYSHEECLERIKSNTEEKFIIYLGHGGSDYLFGATNRNITLSESVGLYSEFESDFSEERFINRDNVGVFANKRVFCFSCNSVPILAGLAFQGGASAFIGFKSIPTEMEEFRESRTDIPLHLVMARFKGELVWIIKHALSISIKKNYNFYQLTNIIKLLTNARINEIVLKHKNLRERRLIADYLYDFKNEIMLVGNKYETLI